jgi:ABC-2 type transport system ATP-binding protein
VHVIEVRELRKAFGTRIAVDGLSFDISQGETLGLLGPNGAGKTTTIQMLTGLLRPDSGEIKIDGVADPMQTAVRRRIGLTPQTLAIYEDMTAEENLVFFGRLYGIQKSVLQSRVRELLDIAGLGDRKREVAKNFSGGMKRRLNLVASLVHQPDILFLDEPTVGVDPQSRNHLFDCVINLASSGTTIIYTTHYMEEAERLCDRVAVVDQGTILAIDTVVELKRKHGGDASIVVEVGRDSSQRERVVDLLQGIFPDRTIRVEDHRLKIQSANPIRDLAKLADSEIDPTWIELERPQLEDVFLNLTGRRLRDS